jgi:ceramide glucosyltransferase
MIYGASVFLLIATLAGAFYLLVACIRLSAFAQRPFEPGTKSLPSFTILKPVAGLEPDLFENLASFCVQAYPATYEVIFCLPNRNDSARRVVERVMERYRWCRTKIAFGENAAMINPKIANVAKPEVELHGDIVVVADSDIRVGPRYLRALAASFANDSVGAVTCLYSGAPNATTASRLGALAIDDSYAPSVLVAIALGELRFCLGATMAIRRGVLEAIGGLGVLGEHLADDHALGQLVSLSGRRVELSRYVVQTTVPETKLRTLWTHELRLARKNLALAPAAYAMSFLMYALPLSLFYLAISRDLLFGIPLVVAVGGLRLALHDLARTALNVEDRDDWRLIPIRDFFSLGIWGASLLGRTVVWRDRRFRTA